MEFDKKLTIAESQLMQKCMELSYAENILELSGIGKRILTSIPVKTGDVLRFDYIKEIQKLSGLGLVSSGLGSHKGETRISHRGCKRLRHYLF